MTLLVQETGKLFGMVDEDERERTRKAPGLRAVVEVIKSRVAVSLPCHTLPSYQKCTFGFEEQGMELGLTKVASGEMGCFRNCESIKLP